MISPSLAAGLLGLMRDLLALFALLAVANHLIPHLPRPLHRALFALLFAGAIAYGAGFPPYSAEAGLVLEPQGALLTVAGLFGGIAIGVATLAIALLVRTYQGGLGLSLDILLGLIAALAGIGAHIWQRRHDAATSLATILAAGSASAAAIWLALLLAPSDATRAAGPSTAAAQFLGVLLLGSLLLIERRHEVMVQLLGAAREKYAHITETVPVMITVSEIETGALLFANERAKQFLAGTRPGTLAPTYQRFEERESFIETLRRDGAVHNMIRTAVRGDGTRRLIGVDARVARWDDKKVILSGAIDLTEIRSREAMIEAITQTTAEGFVVIDSRGVVQSFNPAAERIFGWPAAEIKGRSLNLLIPPEQIPAHEGALRNYLTAGERRMARTDRQVEGLRRDGSRIQLDLSISELEHSESGERLLLGIVRDVSARKRAEEELQRSETRLRSLLDNMPDIVFCTSEAWGRDGREGGVRLYGRDTQKIVGGLRDDGFADVRRWFEGVHPEDRATYEALEQHRKTEGIPYTLQFRFRDPATGEPRWARETAWVVKDELGDHTIFESYILDITEQKRTEEALRTSKEEAESANRSKSAFLANMSHELRTPMNAILGFSELIRDAMFGPLPARYKEYAADIHRSGEHLLTLINDVLDLSKIEAGRMSLREEAVRVADIAQSCTALLAAKAREGSIRIAIEVPSDLAVLGDEIRLKQIVLNLVSNAVKFTPPGGRVTIAGRAVADAVTLTISDTGIGMSAEEVKIALEPFGQVESSYAKRYEGSGLGLPLVQRLVELHHGKLEIESAKGRGTMVRVTLPGATAPSRSEPVVGKPASSAPGMR